MRVAITTDDLEHVGPFARARHVFVYDVRRSGSRLLRTYHVGPAGARCDPQGLSRRGAALEGCLLLLTEEIGPGGTAVARAKDVEVVRVIRSRPIGEVLGAMERELASMRPWTRRVILGGTR
jgi:hypothetical protein